ncbi:MAG: XdhC family protein [Chloroflexi bacterium]|nr:XdhC family protein [Chloroflexota bacterium]
MGADLLNRASELSRANQPFALATVVRAERPTSAKAGAKAIVTADGAIAGWVGGSCAQPTVIREALKTLQNGEPRFVRLCPPEAMGRAPQVGVIEVALTCISGGTLEVYIEPHLPQPHLVVISHLPIAEALAALGKGLGYTVTVMGLDATPARFPEADTVFGHLDFSHLVETPRRGVSTETFIVVATHGNYDEEALEGALKSDTAYVALVASRTRAEAVIQYLRETGMPEERLARIKYPAGLDFGAVTPEEIALSILAEIIQIRRQPSVSRLPLPTSDLQSPSEALDLVCGMMVEIATARYVSQHAGETYYFCSAGCKRSFEKEPETYLTRGA